MAIALADLVLPNINGEFEMGLSVGTNPSFPKQEKLPILAGAAPSLILQNALAWAFTNRTISTFDPRIKAFVYNAIAGAVKYCRLIRRRSTAPVNAPLTNPVADGDWVSTAAAVNMEDAQLRAINWARVISVEKMRLAVRCIAAMKANWWNSNHHTGQGAMVGYPKKIADTHFADCPRDQLTTAFHMVGHWCSTIHILSQGGVEGLRPTAWEDANAAEITFSDDSKLRFQSPPAGTHKTNVAYEGAKRLVMSQIAEFCPEVQEMSLLVLAKERIMKERASLHVGAVYLTGGKANDFADSDAKSYLGRIGTYIMVFMPRSTLAASPHLRKDKVQNYPDYSAEWQGLCNEVKILQSQPPQNLRERLDALVGNNANAMAARNAFFR